MNRPKKNEEENRQQQYYPDVEKSLNLPTSLEAKIKSSLQKIPESSKVHVGASQTLVVYKKKENKITHSYDHQMKKQQKEEKNFYISDGGLKKKIEKFNSYNSNLNNGGTNINNNQNQNNNPKTMRSIQSYPKTINANGSAKHNYVIKNSFFSKEAKETNNGGPKSSLNPNRKKDLNGGNSVPSNVFYKTVREPSKRPVFPNNSNTLNNNGNKKKKTDIHNMNNNTNNQNNDEEEEKRMEIISSLIQGAYNLSIKKMKEKNQKPTIKELLNERKKTFLRRNGIRPSKLSIDDDNSLNNNLKNDLNNNRIIPEENKNEEYENKMSKTSTNFHINKLNNATKSSRGFSPKYQNYLTLNNEKFFNDDKNKLTIKSKNKKGVNKKPIVDQFEFIKKIQKEKKKMFLNDEDERKFLNTCSNEKFFDRNQREKILSNDKDDLINNSFRKKSNSKKKETQINNFMKLKNQNPSSLVDVNNDEFPYSHKKSYRNAEELEKFLKDKKIKTKKINNENEMEKNKKLFVRYKNLYLLNSKWTSPDRTANNFYTTNASNNSNNINMNNNQNNNQNNNNNNNCSYTISNNSGTINKYKNINGSINNNINKKKKTSSQNNYIKKKKEANEFWVGNDSFVKNNSTLVDPNDYYLNVLESQQLLVNSGFDKIKNPSDTDSEKNFSAEEEKANSGDNNQNGNYSTSINNNYSSQRNNNNEDKENELNISKEQIKKITEKESRRKKAIDSKNEGNKLNNNNNKNKAPVVNKNTKSKSKEKTTIPNNPSSRMNNNQNTLTKSNSNKSKSQGKSNSKSKSREKDSKEKQPQQKNKEPIPSKNPNQKINIQRINQNPNQNSKSNTNSSNLSPNKVPPATANTNTKITEKKINPKHLIALLMKLKFLIKKIVFYSLYQMYISQEIQDHYILAFSYFVAALKQYPFRKIEEYCNTKIYHHVFKCFYKPFLRKNFKIFMRKLSYIRYVDIFVEILSRWFKFKVVEKIYLHSQTVDSMILFEGWIRKVVHIIAIPHLYETFYTILNSAYSKNNKKKSKEDDDEDNEGENGLKDDDNSNNEVMRFPQNNSLNDEKEGKNKIKDNKKYVENNKEKEKDKDKDDRGKHFICLLDDAIKDACENDNENKEKQKEMKKVSTDSIDSLISDSSASKNKDNSNQNKKQGKDKDSDEVEVKEDVDIQENIENSEDISAEKEDNKSIDWDYNLSTSKDKRTQPNKVESKPGKNNTNENDDQNLKIEEELQIESLDDSTNNNNNKKKDSKNNKKTLKKDKEPLLNANEDEYNYDFDEVDNALEKKEKDLIKDNEELMRLSPGKNEQSNNKPEKSRNNKEKPIKPKEEEKYEIPSEVKEKLSALPQKEKDKLTTDLVKEIIQDLLKSEIGLGATKKKIVPHKLFRYESNDQLSNSQSGSAGSGVVAGNLKENLTKELHLANLGELNLQDDDLMMLNDSLMSCYSAYSIFNRTVKDKKKEHSLNLYFKLIAPKLIEMIKKEIYLKYDDIYKNISTPLKNNSKGLMVSLTIQDADMLRDNYKCTSDNIKDISVLIDKEKILKNFEPINNQIRSKDNVTSDNFYDRMLNECIVETAIELINKERIYGENGDPLTWSSRMHELVFQYPPEGPKKLADFIEKGILKTLRNRIGLITDNYDYLNAEQINVERERRLLHSIKKELDDDEYQWRNLEMEETQIKIEVTEMIMEQLYNENIEILEHIQYSRNRPDLYQHKSIYDCEDIPKLSFQQTTTENVQQDGDDDN